MVKKYTRKNRTLKGGSFSWRWDGAKGQWVAVVVGAKAGGADMYNAIIRYLGYDAFIATYNKFRLAKGLRARDGTHRPEKDAGSREFLLLYLLPATQLKMERVGANIPKTNEFMDALTKAVTERVGDTHPPHLPSSSTKEQKEKRDKDERHAVRADDEFRFLAQLKKKRGDLSGFGVKDNNTFNHPDQVLAHCKDEALFGMNDCEKFIKGTCTKTHHGYDHGYSCAALTGYDRHRNPEQGYHDETLKAKYKYFTNGWRSQNRSESQRDLKARRRRLRSEMEDDLTSGERASVQHRHRDDKVKNVEAWLKAKINSSLKDRLIRRQKDFRFSIFDDGSNKGIEGLERITAVINHHGFGNNDNNNNIPMTLENPSSADFIFGSFTNDNSGGKSGDGGGGGAATLRPRRALSTEGIFSTDSPPAVSSSPPTKDFIFGTFTNDNRAKIDAPSSSPPTPPPPLSEAERRAAAQARANEITRKIEERQQRKKGGRKREGGRIKRTRKHRKHKKKRKTKRKAKRKTKRKTKKR